MLVIGNLACCEDRIFRTIPPGPTLELDNVWITVPLRSGAEHVGYMLSEKAKMNNDFNGYVSDLAHGVQGVGGSNPLIPTSDFKGLDRKI